MFVHILNNLIQSLNIYNFLHMSHYKTHNNDCRMLQHNYNHILFYNYLNM